MLTLAIGCFLTIFIQRSTMPPKGLSSFATSLFYKTVTSILGIKIKLTGTPNRSSTLFVANHISWIDILVIGQIVPAHFLSMAEVKDWPVIGWLATRAGTLYIPRGGKTATSDSIKEISTALNETHNAVVFAEGRVTDGTVKRFHSRLLQSAIDANATVQPVAIRYPDGDSKLANPVVLFLNGTSFSQSFLKVISTKRIEVEITFLIPIPPDNQLRKELSNDAETQIRKQLGQSR